MADFFSQGLGSKYSFQSDKFTFNKFANLSQKKVLAFDLGFCGPVESLRSMEIASMELIINSAVTRQGAILTAICW